MVQVIKIVIENMRFGFVPPSRVQRTIQPVRNNNNNNNNDGGSNDKRSY